MKFRFNIGSLDASMNTEIEVNSKKELIEAIQKRYDLWSKTLNSENPKAVDVSFEYVGYDDRISRETYHVFIHMHKNIQKHFVGMSDSNCFCKCHRNGGRYYRTPANPNGVTFREAHKRGGVFCGGCLFYSGSGAKCRRYPIPRDVFGYEWCGEFKCKKELEL